MNKTITVRKWWGIKLNNNLKLVLQIGTITNITLYVIDKYAIFPAWVIFPFLKSRSFSWCRNYHTITGCRLERNGWIFIFFLVYLFIFLAIYLIKLKSRENDQKITST